MHTYFHICMYLGGSDDAESECVLNFLLEFQRRKLLDL